MADRNRGGAPLGNMNRLTHGLQTTTVPRVVKCLYRRIVVLENDMIEAVQKRYRRVSLIHAAYIASAVAGHRQHLLAESYLRRKHDSLPFDSIDRLLTLSAAGVATRTRSIVALGLDKPVDPMDDIFDDDDGLVPSPPAASDGADDRGGGEHGDSGHLGPGRRDWWDDLESKEDDSDA